MASTKANNTVVYIHRRKDTNTIFYVGIGSPTRPYTRRKNKMWLGIVKKYGYEVEVLYKGLPFDEACILERYLIGCFGRRDLGKGQLANMTDGGEGNQNMVYTDEWREKQRSASSLRRHSEQTRLKMRQSQLGKKHTLDRIKNISISKQGQAVGSNNPSAKLTEEKVLQIRKEASNGASLLAISRKYNCGWTTIKRVVSRDTWSHI